MDGLRSRGHPRRPSRRSIADHRAVVDDLARSDRARPAKAGFHDFVAKFDRQGLIAAIKEQGDDITRPLEDPS